VLPWFLVFEKQCPALCLTLSAPLWCPSHLGTGWQFVHPCLLLEVHFCGC
jgi:hypothetical protein